MTQYHERGPFFCKEWREKEKKHVSLFMPLALTHLQLLREPAAETIGRSQRGGKKKTEEQKEKTPKEMKVKPSKY